MAPPAAVIPHDLITGLTHEVKEYSTTAPATLYLSQAGRLFDNDDNTYYYIYSDESKAQFFDFVEFEVAFPAATPVSRVELVPYVGPMEHRRGFHYCPSVSVNGTALHRPASAAPAVTALSLPSTQRVTVRIDGLRAVPGGPRRFAAWIGSIKFYS